MKLHEHQMMCPSCLTDDSLHIVYTGVLRLTPDGSEDIGDHEWDDTSPCRCVHCNFHAPIAAFEFSTDEIEAKEPFTFEIQSFGMATCPETGDHILSDDVMFVDIHVRRDNPSTGEVDIIEEYENLSTKAADIMLEELRERYPFAGEENL